MARIRAGSTGQEARQGEEVKESKPKKVSAIDAVAEVLAASKEPMNCIALVEAMATQGLWESPGGQPDSRSTLVERLTLASYLELFG
jgi:hypothetical protein